jgi:uncharacterized protein (TIGR00730 family)
VTHAIASVCVFCGSSPGRDPLHMETARDLGRALAAGGRTLVYGGGGVGLMGACARAALDAGGRAVGVIPQFLCTPELALNEAELQVVGSMHERKAAMFERADAFAILPGGIGTLEEAIELLSWARMNLHRKPAVFLDTGGYWRPLFDLIDHTVAQGFTPGVFTALYRSVATVDEVLPALDAMARATAEAGETPIALI